jgi:HPt (histidine-containing phosphotransfer) domain-containing protein
VHKHRAKDPLKPLITELAAKFLLRTRGDAIVLRELLERAALGDATVMSQLEHLAHRIHGTGATFGFDAISECAAEIEHLVGELKARAGPADAAIESQHLQHLLRCVDGLAQEVGVAAAAS